MQVLKQREKVIYITWNKQTNKKKQSTKMEIHLKYAKDFKLI